MFCQEPYVQFIDSHPASESASTVCDALLGAPGARDQNERGRVSRLISNDQETNLRYEQRLGTNVVWQTFKRDVLAIFRGR